MQRRVSRTRAGYAYAQRRLLSCPQGKGGKVMHDKKETIEEIQADPQYILQVKDLKKHFLIRKEWKLRKVDAEEKEEEKAEQESAVEEAAEEVVK